MARSSSWRVRRGIVWAADLANRCPDRPDTHVPAEFAEIQPGEIAHLLAAAAQMDPIAPEFLLRRFERGRRCYAAWIGGAVAAYGWLTVGCEWVGEFERELNVLNGEAYIWDCVTLPAYRRQRLFSALLWHVAESLARENLYRLWIISVINPSAMKRNMAALGFTPVLSLLYFLLGNRRVLLSIPMQGAAPQQVASARRLVSYGPGRAVGPLHFGSSTNYRPPDTHIPH